MSIEGKGKSPEGDWEGKNWNPNEESLLPHGNEGRRSLGRSRPLPWGPIKKERSGQALLNEKRYGEALETYEKDLLVEPLNPNLHVGKGEALLGLGHLQEALAAYKEAIRLAPEFSEAYRGRGKVYEQLAQQVYEDLTQQAQECYEKAKQLGVG